VAAAGRPPPSRPWIARRGRSGPLRWRGLWPSRGSSSRLALLCATSCAAGYSVLRSSCRWSGRSDGNRAPISLSRPPAACHTRGRAAQRLPRCRTHAGRRRSSARLVRRPESRSCGARSESRRGRTGASADAQGERAAAVGRLARGAAVGWAESVGWAEQAGSACRGRSPASLSRRGWDGDRVSVPSGRPRPWQCSAQGSCLPWSMARSRRS
jgi:hypothetical protein